MVKNKLTHAKIKIEALPLSQLKPHPKNPRKHPQPGTEAWNALRDSLSNVYFDPIVFNRRNGMLVSGHLRTKVLTEMGVKIADCVIVDVDEDQHLALLMRANKNDGVFDDNAVVQLLQQLDGKLDLTLSGFIGDELADLVQQFSDLPQAATPFSEFNEVSNADGSVNFSFGSFKTKVKREVYDNFAKHVLKRQGKDGGVLLDDIIAELI